MAIDLSNFLITVDLNPIFSTIPSIIPSTKIIDLNYDQNLEYSLSKMIMEKYSKSISQNYKLINIFTPRLEAFKTRQSQFMLGVNNNTNDLIQKLFYKI